MSPAPPGTPPSAPGLAGSEHAQCAPRPSERCCAGAAVPGFAGDPGRPGAGRGLRCPWDSAPGRNSPTRRPGGARCSGTTPGCATRGQGLLRSPYGHRTNGSLDFGHPDRNRRVPICPTFGSRCHSTNRFLSLQCANCLVRGWVTAARTGGATAPELTSLRGYTLEVNKWEEKPSWRTYLSLDPPDRSQSSLALSDLCTGCSLA